MKTLPSELSSFKSSVNASLHTLYNELDNLSNKTKDIIKANEKAISKIDTSYDSDNKASVLNSMNNINNLYKNIDSSINTDLKKVLDDSKELISKIDQLEDLIKEIKELDDKKDREERKNDPNYSEINDYKNKIKDKESKYDMLCSEATSLLNKIKNS